MKIEKPKNRGRRYYAHGEDSLRNGSFIRASRYGAALFINGDYMGLEAPAVRGKPLDVPDAAMDGRLEYSAHDAERLIPVVCGGRGSR